MRPSTANVVVLLNERNQILCLRRGLTAPSFPGHWNLPGGYSDADDTSFRAGAARELFEEAGVRVEPISLCWAFSYRDRETQIHVFWLQLPYTPQIQFVDREHDAFVWANLNQLPQPAVPALGFVARNVFTRVRDSV